MSEEEESVEEESVEESGVEGEVLGVEGAEEEGEEGVGEVTGKSTEQEANDNNSNKLKRNIFFLIKGI